MLLRFQLSANTFAHMLRARFARQNLCAGKLDAISVVDRLEIVEIMSDERPPFKGPPFTIGPTGFTQIRDATGTLVDLTGPQLLYTQPVNVFASLLSDLQANPGLPAVTIKFPVFLVFLIVLTHDDKLGDNLVITFHDVVHPETLPPTIKQDKLKAQLLQLLPPVSSSVDFTNAISNIGLTPPLKEVAAALSGTADLSVIEMRLELQPSTALGSSDTVAWQAFLNQQLVDDVTAGADWALLLDRDMVTQIAVQTAQTALTQNAAKFALQSAITPTWNPGAPGLSLELNGDVKDACQCFWGKIDVNTDITIDISFSANAGGVVQQDMHLSHSSNKWQVLCCDVTTAIFWPIFAVQGDFGLLGGLLGMLAWCVSPLLVFVGAVYVASGQPTDVGSIPNCTQDPGDSSHFTCTVDLSGINGGIPYCSKRDDWLEITGVHGVDAGLVVTGTHTDNMLMPPIVAVGAVSQFQWVTPTFNCSSVTGVWAADASVEIHRDTGDLDFFFCSATAIGPMAAAWQPCVSVDFDYCPMRATVHVTTSQFIAGPVSLLISTSGGCRIVNLDPMTPLTQQQIDAFDGFVRHERLVLCYTIPDPWWKYFRMFNPKWLIDPGPGEIEQQQISEVVAWGVPAGQGIRLLTADNTVLAQGIADVTGSVRISAFVARGVDVTIEKVTTGGPAGLLVESHLQAFAPVDETNAKTDKAAPDRRAAGLLVRQILILTLGSVQLPQPAFALSTSRGAGKRPCISVIDARGVTVYEIQQAGRLVTISHRRAPRELCSATVSRGTFIALDCAGEAWRIDSAAQTPPSRICRAEDECVVPSIPKATPPATTYWGRQWDADAAVTGRWLARLERERSILQLYRLYRTAEL